MLKGLACSSNVVHHMVNESTGTRISGDEVGSPHYIRKEVDSDTSFYTKWNELLEFTTRHTI